MENIRWVLIVVALLASAGGIYGQSCTTDVDCLHAASACVFNATCVNSTCVMEPDDSVCDDGNACTINICETMVSNSTDAFGCSMSPVSNGTPCDDGVPCTETDECASGICEGTPIDCSDGNVCTYNVCDSSTGMCLTFNNNEPCDDGFDCTENDVCFDGSCMGEPVICPDADPTDCSIMLCNESTGVCDTPADAANGVTCDDGLRCTTDEMCMSGVCVGLASDSICNDENACTNNFCVPNSVSGGGMFDPGCNAEPLPDGTFCPAQEFDLCSGLTECVAGECVAESLDCDDGDLCTEDLCDPEHGCIHTPVVCWRPTSSTTTPPYSDTSLPSMYTPLTLTSEWELGECIPETGRCVYESSSSHHVSDALLWTIFGLLIALLSVIGLAIIIMTARWRVESDRQYNPLQPVPR